MSKHVTVSTGSPKKAHIFAVHALFFAIIENDDICINVTRHEHFHYCGLSLAINKQTGTTFEACSEIRHVHEFFIIQLRALKQTSKVHVYWD